jgi:hypothetical protein
MNTNKKYAQIAFFILIGTLILVGCSSPKETEPTIDPNAIYTEAAQTVAAQLTAAATEPPAEVPTDPLPPTETPVPALASPTLPAMPAFTQPAPTQMLVTTPIVPTATRPAKDKLEDCAVFLGQYPGDGFEFNPGSKFDGVFTFQNNCDTTWNSFYSIRRYQGESFGLGSKFIFDDYADNKTVEKGEAVTITVPGMQAPLGKGSHSSFWCLYNNREDAGKTPQCFYLFTIEIIVN